MPIVNGQELHSPMNDIPICFGAIFYFFADPAVHRDAIRSSMMLWQESWNKPFTRMSRYGDSFRSYPMTKSLDQVLMRLYDPHDFQRSSFFTFFDGEPKGAIEAQLLFWGATIDERWKLKTPNYVYVQTSAGVDIEQCWNLFQQTAAMFPVHLALGNFMITCNPEAEPRSGATACRSLRQSEYLLHEFDTSFRNESYLRLLERRDEKFLIHPSQFVAIGGELSSFCRPAFQATKACGDALTIYASGEGQVIRIRSDAGVEAFSTIFAPHYGAVDRPRMFWKEPEWRRWLAKMQGSQPGKLFEGLER